MDDWVFLRPARFDRATFDEARQTLCWPLIDADEQCLVAELAFDAHTSHAIRRIESHPIGANAGGTIVVARMRGGTDPSVVEPLSFVLSGKVGSAVRRAIDALHFDEGRTSVASRFFDRLTRGFAAPSADQVEPVAASRSPAALKSLRYELRRWAEKGMADEQHGAWSSRVEA